MEPSGPPGPPHPFSSKNTLGKKTGKSPDTRQGAGPPWLILGGQGTLGPHATTTPSTQFTQRPPTNQQRRNNRPTNCQIQSRLKTTQKEKHPQTKKTVHLASKNQMSSKQPTNRERANCQLLNRQVQFGKKEFLCFCVKETYECPFRQRNHIPKKVFVTRRPSDHQTTCWIRL